MALRKRISNLFARLRRASSTVIAPPKPQPLFVTPQQGSRMGGGETVYNEPALRFRNLSIAEPDLPTFGDLPGGKQEGFKIRVAKHQQRRREAHRMVSQRYEGRGYQVQSGADTPDPHLSTFLAYDEGRMVGTVSVRLDSTNGLSADQLYPDEVRQLRGAGHKLCEFTRLAVDTKAASKPVLASLFHTAFLWASRMHGFTHAVIEVNPRHVAFYERSLGFEVRGGERMNLRDCAPAVLLEVPFSRIEEGLHRAGRQVSGTAASLSLLRHGFPPADEVGILARLREKERAA